MKAALVALAVLVAVGPTACSSGGSPKAASRTHAADHRWFASARAAVKHDCKAFGNVHVVTPPRVLAAQWTTASQYGSGYGWFAHLKHSGQGYRVTDCRSGAFAPHH
jgi:hypothetical protein